MGTSPTKMLLALAALGLVVRFLVIFYRRRSRFRNLPGPPHNWLLGHLHIMGKYQMKFPPRAHPYLSFLHVQQDYNLPLNFYIDLWPISDPLLVLLDPDAAQQITVDHSLPKSVTLTTFTAPVAGEKNLIILEGAEWKKWRAVFNPGFSNNHIMTLVPNIVDTVITFRQLLGEAADANRLFRLEEMATKLTFDVITKVVIDHNLNTQLTESELINAMRDGLNLLPTVDQTGNPLVWLESWIRPLKQRGPTRRMNNYIGKILDQRIAEYDPSNSRGKSVVDLAISSYFKLQKESGQSGPVKIDSTFRRYAIDQIKAFLLAGHDTTSSTICYAYYLLFKNPVALATVRAELDSVFGKDTSRAAQMIKENPHLLNSIPYTSAVVRETLRLYGPASTSRRGEPGFYVTDKTTGQSLATEGFGVWAIASAIGISKQIWGPDVNEFRPERFLPENVASLPKHAWRPFEMGPRNCIGQELALIEARLTLVLTLREYDFHVTFDLQDIEALKNDDTMWGGDSLQYNGGDVDGDKAFPVLILTAKPNQGMPARVERRKPRE